MAMAQQSAASLGPVLSFGDTNKQAEEEEPTKEEEYGGAASVDDSGDDDDQDFEFEFAFAPPLAGNNYQADAAPADDIFAQGRILPAYPVFDRRLLLQQEHEQDQSSSSAAVPEPDTYCAWVPRSAPGSPARRDATSADTIAVAFPKSASTGEPRRRLRLRDILLGSSGRSHSDGKEKFVFLQPPPTPKSSSSAAAAKKAPATTPSPLQQKQQGNGNGNGSKKKKGAAVTEMDMATAHRLFYSKTGTTGGGGAAERKLQTSFLTYRPAFVGFFASAPGRSSHHPY